ncbi:MAG: TolC family protein [Deltaproteobacteria bacterium]|nr:TolC family protein [Deltaproteobacteria bacterium]
MILTSFLAALLVPLAAPEPLSFTEAVRRARTHHPLVEAARAGAAAATRRATAAWAWDDPQLGAQLWNVPLSNVEGALLPGRSAQDRARTLLLGPDSVPVMVTASQTFPWPGKRAARADEARAMAEEADATVTTTSADVDRAVAYAYADLRAAASTGKTFRDNLHFLDGALAAAEARLEAATGSLADMLAAQTERDSAERALLDFALQEEVARARLAALMGVVPSEVGAARDVVVVSALPSRERLLEHALRGRPEFRAAHAQVAAASARARAERLAALPDVTLTGGYTLAVGGLPVAVSEGPYRALLGPADMITVGVNIPVPLFYPWKQSRAAQAADIEVRRANANTAALMRTVQADVDEALAGIQHARGHMSLHAEKLIPLSLRSAEAAEAAYVSGTGNVLMLLGAARAVREHQLEFLEAQREYALRLADLQRATGMELVAFGENTHRGKP